MKKPLFIATVCLSLNSIAQEKDVFTETDSLLIAEGYDLSDTAYQNEYAYPDIVDVPESEMSQIEKDVVYYLNYARTKPAEFCTKFILLNKDIEKNEYYTSCVKTMMTMRPVKELAISPTLNGTSKYHLYVKVKYKIAGHGYQSKGIHSYLQSFYGSECIQGGYNDALKIVVSLLVDNKVKSLGHRKDCLEGFYTKVGVSTNDKKTTIVQFSQKHVN